MTDLAAAADLLRAAGWTVLPPPGETLPEPAVGQVWVSPKPRVEARTVVKVGAGRGWSEANTCVFFTTPTRPPSEKWGPNYITADAWRAWVRKAQARPA